MKTVQTISRSVRWALVLSGVAALMFTAVVVQRRVAAQNAPTQNAAAAKAAVASAKETLSHDDLVFFESKIRPVLVEHCYKCHSADAEKIKGGLMLDTREGIRNGGSTGHAVIPGDVEGSLLIKAIRYTDSDTAMPPAKSGGKLPDAVIADFEKWVRMGAPDPRDGKAFAAKAIDLEKGREHWAFKLPRRQPAPAVKDSAWAHNAIDQHVLAALEAKNLKPVADADKATLLRRVYFDLIGLPPTPEEVRAFTVDNDPKAFEKVVDKLLASPQFGERWGRHWLDVARYAESSGKEQNVAYPHAWRYRDYVIKAFNEDKPYDRFLKEQLAGDLLKIKNDDDWANNLIATGYLAVGAKSHNTRLPRQFALDVADEQIDAIGQGMLGLTIACARCHDHKFDPIPQADYYAMAGIFLSTETRFGTPRIIQNNNTSPLIELPASKVVTQAPALTTAELEAMKRQVAAAKADRDEVLAEARKKNDRGAVADPRLIRSQLLIGILEKLIARYDEQGKPINLAMGVQDRMYPRDTQLLARGEMEKPMDAVPRGFVQVVSTKPTAPIKSGSGRLELAEWIASPENPLTARVMANRVWLHLFGTGIVPTPDNFGTTGRPPTNQPLLDHLAIRLVENGWSVKKLIREIVLSHTYQLGSAHDATAYAVDPDNTLHWRMSPRRLDAEALRDAMLAVAGRLDLTAPVGSPVAKVEGPVQQLLRPLPGAGFAGRPPGRMFGTPPENPLEKDYAFRSVYLPVVRDQVPDSLEVFDFAEPSLVIGARDATTVPSQALYLMNSTSVQKLAEAMAARLVATKLTGMELTKYAFQLAYSRPPTAREIDATTHFFKTFSAAEAAKYPDKAKLGFAGLTAFCQGLLGSAEFRYVN